MEVSKFIGIMIFGWVFFGVMVGVILGGRKFLRLKKYSNLLIPGKADPSKMCKGPHSWITAKTITRVGSSESNVCRVCGFVSGHDKMVSSEAIDRIEESNKNKEIEEKLMKSFLAEEYEKIKEFLSLELKSGLDFEKIASVHGAGLTFTKRFQAYKLLKADDIEREIKKSDS
jgi:hypothetical protein